MTLVLGDAIAMSLLNKNKFTKKEFSELHPGGELGRMLLKVKDVMKTGKKMPLIKRNEKMSNAIIEMTSKGFGCVGVVSEKTGVLVGMITDGDLRRNMNENLLLKKISAIMTIKPKSLDSNMFISDALKKMNDESITNSFITANKKPIGILHVHEILKY